MKAPRIMLAAVSSGSGKTLLTCALLQAMTDCGKKAAAFKCGPDYIDPMFHRKVLGVPSKNLDTFFTDENTTRALLLEGVAGKDISVLEGVMGLYDGLGGIQEEASSYHLAKVTGTPILLVVDAHGMGRSLIPLIAGFLQYDTSHLIKGVLLNRISKHFYETIKPELEAGLPIRVLGYFPKLSQLRLESRHLGLLLPDEVRDLREQVQLAADTFRSCVNLEEIERIASRADMLDVDRKADIPEANDLEADRREELHLQTDIMETGTGTVLSRSNDLKSGVEVNSSQADDMKSGMQVKSCQANDMKSGMQVNSSQANDLKSGVEVNSSQTNDLKSKVEINSSQVDTLRSGAEINSSQADTLKSEAEMILLQANASKLGEEEVRIAVAQDEAFCFYYEDNLKLLERFGARLEFFSPLRGDKLPDRIHGLLLGGGYPELYAEELSQNHLMRESIRRAIEQGIPSLAECGGFMYLHEAIENPEGKSFPMAGVVQGSCHYTGKLVRFGYISVTSDPGTFLGSGIIRGHEFHYYDSTDNGAACTAEKPVSGRAWQCIHAGRDYWWGFPHLYYYSNPEFVRRYLERARAYAQNTRTWNH